MTEIGHFLRLLRSKLCHKRFCSQLTFILLFDYSIWENEDLIVVHEALNFGDYHFSIVVSSNLLWS
ncbi:hypothetical protein ISN45_Aa02g007050 [Arabidopsis thaliana x Arabidopsis arenosa]|uniref:Uncharacterized protein n=1 Tax=Arabidopsis thaliana x Arabidopsis arenosa TaxID=1240361 RepID=A0A8T2BER4_9BRAS|nr:hypothetical protein ISN45_Aa02g007050 [Arabidopsis thaliana x Arabidopsis arenosa]